MSVQNKFKYKFPHDIKIINDKLKEELLKDFRGEPDGYCLIGESNYFFPENVKNVIDEIYNFEARSDDVWIATYPRSGTTMTQELVWLLMNDLDFNKAKEIPLHIRSIFFDFDTIINPKIDSMYNLGCSDLRENLNKMKSPRVIKTHLPFSMLPPSVFKNKCKIIYVARNPLDVAVSFYHHNRLYKSSDYIGDFKKYWDYFKNGHIIYAPHLTHVKEAWKQRNNSNILFIFYENMIKDFVSVLNEITMFLNKNLTNSERVKITEHLNIEKFRKNPCINDLESLKTGFMNSGEEGFIRKGGILKNNKEFDGDLFKTAVEWMNDQLKDSDLKFPIEDLIN